MTLMHKSKGLSVLVWCSADTGYTCQIMIDYLQRKILKKTMKDKQET